MTIKASSQITISKVIDIHACYRYYKLQGSTLAKPTKPTKNPPDGWSDTEPAYISGSTNTLYFVDCNVYSDKSFSFSEVSKSSSYEAAKDAWNKANKAQDTATNAQNKVDNLQIGGRNLKLNGDFKKGITAYATEGGVNVSIENDVTYTKCAKVVFSTAYASERLYTSDYNNRYNLLNTVYTLSFVAKASSNLKLNVYRGGTAQGIGETNLSTEWKKFEMTYTATGTGSVTFKLNSAGTLYLANIKIELGNVATDWTPAPEDSIAKVDVEYYLSTSATSLAGGSWTTTAPTWVNGKYMWSRTVMIDGAGNKTYSPNQNGVCIAGAKGATGPQGPKGDKGNTGATGNGVKSIVEQYYQSTSATSLAGGSWTTTYPGWVNGKYIWTRSVITYTSGNDVTTTPICVTGQKGDTGAKGDKGNTGATGAAGKSIGSVVNYYLATNASSGVTTSTAGWTTNVQSVTATNKYLWNYEVIKYTDGSVASTTTPCIIGAYGDKGATGPKGDKGTTGATGATGKGIKSVTEHYAVSASNSTAPTSWSTTVPTMTSTNRYLWNYETIAYTDNSTSDTTKRVIGVYGDKGNTGATGPQGVKGDKGDKGNTGATGAAGKGVKSTAITYQASTSGVVTPTGTWSTTIPAVSAGSYLWTRTIITYTDNSTSTSYSVGKMGNTGATGAQGPQGVKGDKGDKGNTGPQGPQGAAGKGIKSTSVTYQAGITGVAIPTGTWSTSVPATSAAKPFLWSRTIITYTDNTSSTTYSVGSTADSVQVGSRNLFPESGMWTTLPTWWASNGGGITLDKTVTHAGNYTLKTTVGTGIVGAKGGFIELDPTCVYTYSALIRSVDTGFSGYSNIPLHYHCSKDQSDISAGIQIIAYNQTLVANAWSLLYLTFKPNAKYFRPFVYIGSGERVLNIAYLKLEKGNKATDWTPAPEDLIKSITEANTAIEQVDEKISMKASTETVTEIANKANNLDKALTDAKTVIRQNSDAIASLTARDFKVEFTTITKQLETLNGDLSSYKEEIGNWMRFDAEGNLVLGATRVPGQDAYELKLTKNRISFMLNDDEVAYISNNELYITNSTVVQNLKIGRFVWEIRGNGNLGLVWR